MDLTSPETEKLRSRYAVQSGLDTVMLFREDWTRAAASVSMADIPTTTLHQVIADNQLLTLPRLSSQVLYSVFYFLLLEPTFWKTFTIHHQGRFDENIIFSPNHSR